MQDQTILILGGPKSGKTHYGAQLAIRLKKDSGTLRYYDQPENLTPFEESMECLGRGQLAKHTPVGISKDVVLPIELEDGSRARVVWPDYGGEQIKEMLRTRETPPAWVDRAKTAQGWLLMIRPELFRSSRDLLHRPLKDFKPSEVQSDQIPEWMLQAEMIETLQMLLFSRRSGRESKIESPKIVVAITCWDESLSNGKETTPDAELQRIAPMLANYISAMWDQESLTTVGISALGKELSPTKADEAFIDLGPHRQGFVVLPDGTKTDDLTWPLNKLLI